VPSEDLERVAARAAELALEKWLEKTAHLTAEYLTTEQAATYLGLSAEFLEVARYKADDSGPPFITLQRLVRYRRADLDAWMEQRKISTPQDRRCA
jgi:excisionase family DNA binding protein